MTLTVEPPSPCSLPRRRPDRRLQRLVAAQELFDRSRPLTECPSLESDAVWAGVGVGSRKVSRALPLDVLILVYAQEMVRRALGLRQSILLVADSNARQNGLNELEVRCSAARTTELLRATVRALGFPVVVTRASEGIDLASVPAPAPVASSANPYVAQQLRQMEWMRRTGARVKVGWRLSSALADELAFDRLYAAAYAKPKLFVYTTPGRTLDPKRPRACPYLCDRPHERLLLSPSERIEKKLALAAADPTRAPAAAGYRRLLGKLARAHVHLTGGGDPRSPEHVLQALLDRL